MKERVRAACIRCGRDRQAVTIVAVTKYVGVAEAEDILTDGFTELGENRWQNAKAKWEAIGERANWHFIGHLQTNKVKDVVGRFNCIHSLDRLALAEEISRKAVQANVTVDVFIQLNVSGETSKYGLAPTELMAFAAQIRDLPGLRVVGLMTMAPYATVPEEARPVFRELRKLRDALNEQSIIPYPVEGLSMGMSGDYEIAIEEGATHVRLGSVLFNL